MTDIENDFVEFLSLRNKRDMLQEYLNTKREFDFGSKEFRLLGTSNYKALRVFFSDRDEASAIEAYQYFAYQDLLRMLSYSFHKPPTVMGYIRTALKKIKKGDIQRTKVRNLPGKLLAGRESPTIVDYGCGLGYLSFELAKRSPRSHIFLIDIGTIKLDFALFRFKKHGFTVEPILVTAENPYPELPPHDICIAQEVMEHLHNPLQAYTHIANSMESSGYLYGDFSDHKKELFHVSANLEKLRSEIDKNYGCMDVNVYKKKVYGDKNK
jgi:2-polyprenyl-3-methyl-5-hydroxy-6-metoxy-1,4-benzoquinol methylase